MGMGRRNVQYLLVAQHRPVESSVSHDSHPHVAQEVAESDKKKAFRREATTWMGIIKTQEYAKSFNVQQYYSLGLGAAPQGGTPGACWGHISR